MSQHDDAPKEDRFPNVHDVLQEAADETALEAEKWVTVSFRMPEKLKQLTDSVCRSNGTDASKFYRKCAERLVNDYLPNPSH